MLNSEALVESKALRESVIARTEVLNKVKKLTLLPDDLHVTVEMAANYYEVDYSAIDSILRRHKSEFESDGVRTISSKDGAFVKLTKPIKPSKDEGCDILSQAINPNQRIVKLIPQRSILRLGMLLRDSEIAKAIRNYLLDAETHSRPQVPLAKPDPKEFEQLNKLMSMLRLGVKEGILNQASEKALRLQIAETVAGDLIQNSPHVGKLPEKTVRTPDNRPQWVKDGYGAKTIGRMLGLSATKVGIFAKKNGFQTPEYGAWYEYTKNGNLCKIFIYNEEGKNAILDDLDPRRLGSS